MPPAQQYFLTLNNPYRSTRQSFNNLATGILVFGLSWEPGIRYYAHCILSCLSTHSLNGRPSKRRPGVPFKVESGPGQPESSSVLISSPAWWPLPSSPIPEAQTPACPQGQPLAAAKRGEQTSGSVLALPLPASPGAGDGAPGLGPGSGSSPRSSFLLLPFSLRPLFASCPLLLLSFPSPPFLSLPSPSGEDPLPTPHPPKLSLYLTSGIESNVLEGLQTIDNIRKIWDGRSVMGTGGTKGKVSNKERKEREVVIPMWWQRLLLRQYLANYWQQIQGN